MLTGRRDRADIEKKIREFGMFVGPALSADATPQLRFLGTRNPHPDVAVIRSRRFLNRSVKNVADLDRPVPAGAEQVERGDPCERAHFVKRGGATVQEEALDHIERGRAQRARIDRVQNSALPESRHHRRPRRPRRIPSTWRRSRGTHDGATPRIARRRGLRRAPNVGRVRDRQTAWRRLSYIQTRVAADNASPNPPLLLPGASGARQRATLIRNVARS